MEKHTLKKPTVPVFALGADVSWLPMMEATGFPFKNHGGEPQDCLQTLKSLGMNTLRLRTWVNPSCHPFSGHCSTAETLTLGLRGQAMGFDVMINFHYGDSWCDPAKQKKPAAWESLPFDGLLDAVSDYTRDAMDTFVRGGLKPKWAQIGNETNPGLLLPDGSTDDFSRLARLYNAGHDAVKSVSPETLTIIHLAEGNHTTFCVDYFDQLARQQCRYDMIGLSYYPWWLNTTNDALINDLAETLRVLPERFDKDVMIVETGGDSEQETETYQLLHSVIQHGMAAPRCRGVLYWEPQGAKIWSGYGLSAWRDDGTPSPALAAFRECK